MQHNRVGRSGFYTSELSLGTMLFGEGQTRSTSKKDAIDICHAFVAAGGSHIDTANAYAGGESERIIGEAVQAIGRDKVTLASKARFATSIDSHFGAGLSRKVIKTQIEQTLKSLQTDYLDLYYMHGWDPHTPIEESLRAYEELIQEGKVLYLGVSNFRAWQVMQSLGISEKLGLNRFVAGQYQYSLVQRDIDNEYMSLFADQGLSCMAWGPLGGGFLTGKYRQGDKPTQGRIAMSDDTVEEAWWRRNTERNWAIMDVIQHIALTHNASISQIALAWLRQHSQVATVIIGPRTLEQCHDNVAAVNITLSAEEWQALDEVSALGDSYPYSMIRAYGME